MRRTSTTLTTLAVAAAGVALTLPGSASAATTCEFDPGTNLVRFEFSSDDPGAELECSLDGAGFGPCASPVTERVKKGKHSFAVRGTDELGNVEGTPATHNWKLKRKRKRR